MIYKTSWPICFLTLDNECDSFLDPQNTIRKNVFKRIYCLKFLKV